MPDHDEPLTPDDAERERLREVLAFPDAIEAALARARAVDQRLVEELPDVDEVDPIEHRIEQLGERVDALTVAVERLAALDARVEELGERLIEKMDDALAARMQRFEALSQAMMTLVGEPVDALTAKLRQLAHEREATLEAAQALRTAALQHQSPSGVDDFDSP